MAKIAETETAVQQYRMEVVFVNRHRKAFVADSAKTIASLCRSFIDIRQLTGLRL